MRTLTLPLLMFGLHLATATQVTAIQHCDLIVCVPYEQCSGSLSFLGPCLQNGQRQFKCTWSGNSSCEGFVEGWCYCTIGGGCFLAGTLITMSDGSKKPIEQVEQGDWVLGFDAPRDATPSQVLGVHPPRVVDHYLIINETLRVSATQPLLSGGSWIEAGRLEIGSVLMGGDGVATPVFSLRTVAEKATVYNLSVSDGVYLSEGFVAHNKDHWMIYNPLDPEGGP